MKSLGPSRLAAMGAVALGLVGFFVFIVLRFSAIQQVPLYTGLSMGDSAAIAQQLTSAGTAFTMKDNGTTILVDETKLDETRMTLAQQGLPAGDSVGYEIFDKTDALGTTSFVQSVNALRALEGELSRTIRTIRQVDQARVHLVLPEKQLFKKDEQKPTAAIVLKTRGTLDPGQIRAIQHLVGSAVPGLDPSRISVVDETGRLLAQGNGDESSAAYLATNADERTAAYQTQVENRVRDIVESVVGAGRARVRVAAELDFNRIQETQDTYDPNGQVVRSTQTREEKSLSQDNQGNPPVTAGNQIPNANQGQNAQGTSQTSDNAQTTEETVNYEISKVTRTQVTEVGGVKRLSVAVLVDGRYEPDANGVMVYAPRPQPELDQITALVRTAMGFDDKRGDQLQVVNLQFADSPPTPADFATTPASMFDFSREDIMRFAEMGVLILVTLLVLLFAVRPLIRRILGSDIDAETLPAITSALSEAAAAGRGAVTVVLNPDGKPVVLGPDGLETVAETPELPAPPSDTRIENAKAQGAQQLDQVRKVGELVNDNPNEAAIIIRNWLSEVPA
ncbi:flagellar basal-body MS-ring/collar protein FliF [Pleomorphomonas sp. NRK KF1]|uniref:flagellar basal-body MS-ring/collar protein FliF n=1 Tax=Pleomorphomonas sp. NRK KF1 TaxID=2943000 RepID=UPI002044AB27|nr:flagellar basal-body MS-ring/collar protein FliF [Pleomorphomonas sp. NRK KF1]MCM5555902.1 flagellar M-ring protein FliF [Pleomorphomonas sp. NRK KF1]